MPILRPMPIPDSRFPATDRATEAWTRLEMGWSGAESGTRTGTEDWRLECAAPAGAVDSAAARALQNYDMNMNEVHIMMLYNTPS